MRIRHYRSIDEVIARAQDEVPSNPWLSGGRQPQDAFVWVKDGSRARLVASPTSIFWSPYLYRGQWKRWAECVPSVFRGLPKVDHPHKLSRLDRARCFVERIRLNAFLGLLPEHPAFADSESLSLIVCGEALAQHYGLQTDRMDLSQDPWVAAFFATSQCGPDGKWRPVKEGQGVFYRVHMPTLKQWLGETRSFALEWIGKQTWPRPGEQQAWTLLLPLGCDFEQLPIEAWTFDQNEESSAALLDRFSGGQDLFPPDVLSEVADEIREATALPRTMVRQSLSEQGYAGRQLEDECAACAAYLEERFDIQVVAQGKFAFTSKQRARAAEQLEQRKQTFLDSVKVLAVRDVV